MIPTMVTETYRDGILKFNARVRIQAYDWDSERKQQLISNVGFRITQPGKSDKNIKAGKYSVHSPLYGTDWGDEHAFEDRYSCDCKSTIGKAFLGKICPICKTEVKFVDIDMTKTGWVVLDHDHIIQPLFYQIIEKFIDYRIPLNSIICYVEPKDRDPDKVEKNPFFGIGIFEFENRFDEIMEYFLKQNRKTDAYNYIMINKRIIFSSSIPVFSSYLRPFIISGEDIKYTDEDTLFKQIFTDSVLLNNEFVLDKRRAAAAKRNNSDSVFKLRREQILYGIQTKLNKLWELVFNTINKKTGFIRTNINGGRMNFTARNVIIPHKDLKADEIILGYTTCLEFFKLELVAQLREIYGIPDPDAWIMWERAKTVFDQRIYDLMKHMITSRPVYALVNRNPTIDYGSQMIMRVIDVTSDMTDNTMKMPIYVLKSFNADFDGDILNILIQKIPKLTDIFVKQLSPRYNLFISRNDGKFNMAANIYRDQVVGLYNFANIETDTDTDMNYDDILTDDSLLTVKI